MDVVTTTVGLTDLKFRLVREDFADAVAWVARILPSRPTVPVLSGVLLTGSDDGLLISGYDYEVSAEVRVAAEIASPGSVLVSGRLLSDITRSLPAKPVDVSVEGTRVSLTCGSARFSLPTMAVVQIMQAATQVLVNGWVNPNRHRLCFPGLKKREHHMPESYADVHARNVMSSRPALQQVVKRTGRRESLATQCPLWVSSRHWFSDGLVRSVGEASDSIHKSGRQNHHMFSKRRPFRRPTVATRVDRITERAAWRMVVSTNHLFWDP